MASIRFQLLGILAILAAVARSDYVNLLNDIPVGTIMDEGTTFVLRWDWDGDATGVGRLGLSSFDLNDSNTLQRTILEEKLNLTMGSYPWVVKPLEGRKTLDWYYRLGISYATSSISGRSFMIKALPSPSTTSTTSTSSTASGARSSGTETSMRDESAQATPDSSPALTGGAIAGIVVGVLAGVGLFATLVGLVVYYRRKSRREKEIAAAAGSSGSEKDSSIVEAQYHKPELGAGPGNAFYELDGAYEAQEMEAWQNPTELDSNARSELAGDVVGARRRSTGHSVD